MIFQSIDKEAISKIYNHPKVYKWISDDCSPRPYEPVINNSFIYLIDETKNGVIRIEPVNSICCQVHTALSPEIWGKGFEFVKNATAWGFQNTRYMKIITLVPEYNRLAISLCKKCGFKQEGIIEKSFLKNWKLYDQILFGLTKKQFLINNAKE